MNSPPRHVVIYVRRSSALARDTLLQAVHCLRALLATACGTIVVVFHHHRK